MTEEEKTELEQLKNQIDVLEMEKKYLVEQLQDFGINLEIANERWVKTVNELGAKELELRKLKKKENN